MRLWLVFAYVLCTLCQAQVRPLHSAPDGICETGFFRTSDGSTCQRCSGWRTCTPGTYRTECNPTSDVQCLQCATEAGQVFEGPNCTMLACTKGLYLSEAQACLPCPVGKYCTGGQVADCAIGEGTVTAGADTFLQCVPLNPSTHGLSVQVRFHVEAPSSVAYGECKTDQEALLAHVMYGQAQPPCVLTADVIGTMVFSSFTCWWMIGQAVEAQFNVYLEQVLPDMLPAVESYVRGCTNDAKAVVYNVTWLAQRSSKVQASRKAKPGLPSKHVPLQYKALAWGSTQKQVAYTLLSMVVVGAALVLSLGMMGAALWLRR